METAVYPEREPTPSKHIQRRHLVSILSAPIGNSDSESENTLFQVCPHGSTWNDDFFRRDFETLSFPGLHLNDVTFINRINGYVGESNNWLESRSLLDKNMRVASRKFQRNARRIADAFLNDDEDVGLLLVELGKEYGKLTAAQIEREKSQTGIAISEDDSGKAIEIRFLSRGANLTEDQAACLVELTKTWTTIAAVLENQAKDGLLFSPRKRSRNREYYIARLAEIAAEAMRIEQGSAKYALLLLQAFKLEFVEHEAGYVKNSYARRLIWNSAMLAIILYFAWGLATLVFDQSIAFLTFTALPYIHAAIGASIGACLSFVIRKPTLLFSELSSPEADMLAPQYKLIFVVAMTWVISWMLSCGLFPLTVGEISIKVSSDNESMTLLIGAFCGLAERAVSNAVAERAGDFASMISRSDRLKEPSK